MYTRPDLTKKEVKLITKHPCQNFIKYLILTNQSVVDILKSYDLPDMPLTYLDYLKTTLPSLPLEFSTTNKYHKPSAQYLRDVGVYNLVFQDKSTKEALSYLTNFEVRPLIQDFLLSRMKPQDVAKKINSKLNTLCTEEAIDRFRHYFWNTQIMRLEDWSKIFAQPSDRHKISSIVRNGARYAAHKHGFMEKVEAKEALKEALGIIYFDMQDWKHKPTSAEKTKSVSLIAHDIAMIDDRLSSSDVTMKETLKQFAAFRTTHIKSRATPINETASLGNYSNSGMMLSEPVNTKATGVDDYVVADLEE